MTTSYESATRILHQLRNVEWLYDVAIPDELIAELMTNQGLRAAFINAISDSSP